ncbi:MAG: diguanylate cyclase, partial [Firmicutes bacterium]|nr:diguanylate cyclase [Bacillota bacterium]
MLFNLVPVTEITLKIIENILILFVISFIYIINNMFSGNKKFWQQILAGILIGISAILLMMFSYEVSPGIFYDTQSILYSISGLFFGPIALAISVVVGLIFRIFFIGGAGILSGCLIILIAASIGFFWKKLGLFRKINPFVGYYLFGLLIHLTMIICYLPLVTTVAVFDTIKSLIIPSLILFPLLSFIACLPLYYQKGRADYLQSIEQQEKSLRASMDAPNLIEMYSVDRDYRYLSFNRLHTQGMKKYFGADIKINDDFLKYIDSPKALQRLKANIDGALNGFDSKVTYELEKAPGVFFEESSLPLKDQNGQIIGVTVFTQDVTEQKKYEKKILENSYRDVLTGFYNRRYLTEHLSELDNPSHFPLSLMISDINDLKLINDGFGHLAGDNLLLEVTRSMTKIIPSNNWFIRTGGDEFMVLLPKTSLEESRHYIQHIVDDLSNKSIDTIKISVAFGVAVKDSQIDFSKVFLTAEKEMYETKFLKVHNRQNELVKKIARKFFATHPEEEQHAERVAHIADIFGEKLEMNRFELQSLNNLARLHNIGKIGFDHAISEKEEIWAADDLEANKKHVEIGYHILA